MVNPANIKPKDVFCTCCKGEREAKGITPRVLTPVFVEGNMKPYLICGHCDGDALIGAKALEQKPANE